jgi:toxin ParE1/3/4
MKLRWTQAARADLKAIHHYIAFRNPKAAEDVQFKIIKSARQLMFAPEIGRTTERRPFRLLPVTGLPYLLLYRVSTEYVEIGSVIDGRMGRAPDIF